MNGYAFPRYGGDIVKSYGQKAWASLRKGDAQQTKQQFDVLLREGIRKRFGQHFDEAHRSFLEEELYVIGARGAECRFLHYLDVLNKVKRFAFPYVCSIQNTSLVCYCLGITQVDPVMTHSRFEHFLSLGTERIPGLWVELSSSKKEEALRRLGFSRHFIYFCEKERICEVSVQQAEHFFMHPSFKNPAVLAALVPDGLPAERVPRSLSEYVNFCAAERSGKIGIDGNLLFAEDEGEMLHIVGYPYAKVEQVREHCARGTPDAIARDREDFCRTASKQGMPPDQAGKIYDTFRSHSRYAVSRACMTAVAQYRYMEAYYKRRAEKELS